MKRFIFILSLTILFININVYNIYSQSDCPGLDPNCFYGIWQTNTDNYGDPSNIEIWVDDDWTCYYKVFFEWRDVTCGTNVTKQIKITRMEKVGNCPAATASDLMREATRKILLESMLIFPQYNGSLGPWQIDIITPSCWDWYGDVFQPCDGDCCNWSYTVHFIGDLATGEWNLINKVNNSVDNYCPGSPYGGSTCNYVCDGFDLMQGPLTRNHVNPQCDDPCPTIPFKRSSYFTDITHYYGLGKTYVYYDTRICNNNNEIRFEYINVTNENIINNYGIPNIVSKNCTAPAGIKQKVSKLIVKNKRIFF